ncbi:MAG: VWA domain-containing protein [bacterium]|nr:VWA domain-containing protein [bacterium]
MFNFLNFLSQNVPPWGRLFFGTEILFSHPGRFLWGSLIFIFAVLVAWEWRKRKRAFKEPSIELHRSTSRFPSASRRICWWAWFSIAIALLVAAYANPEKVKTEWERVFGKIRITFIFDSSISMKKSEDVEPNRFEAAKNMMRDLVLMLGRDPELKGRYPLALIPFSGSALPYFLPFTTSKDELLSVLDSLDVEVITKKGTSLWAALRAYDELLLDQSARDKGTIDIGILISDGGKEEGKKERALLPQTIKDLRDPYRVSHFLSSGERIIVRAEEPKRKVVLHTIGVGVAKSVPLKNRDKAGNFMGYEHEKDGDPKSPILNTTLDEQILREIAKKGGGTYRHFSDRETIIREFKEIVLFHRIEIDKIAHPQYESVRAWFLFPSFIILYFLFGYGGWILRIVYVITRRI